MIALIGMIEFFCIIGLFIGISLLIFCMFKKKSVKKPIIIIIASLIAIILISVIYSRCFPEESEAARIRNEQKRIEKEQEKAVEEMRKQEEQERIEAEKEEEERKRLEEERLKADEESEKDKTSNEEETEEHETVSEIEERIDNEPSIEIYATDLLNDWSNYVGKKVTVSYACDRCEDDEQSIQSAYDSNAGLYLRSYVDNYRQFAYGDYLTVTGTVDSKYAMYIEIKNAHIDYFGNDSQLAYEQGKNEYDERKRVEAEEYEKQFKENAETPTYDDLIRYPDTYKEIKIKVKVKIVRIEPDGLIFDGDIEATMSGEKIALYDNRETKEPKLREGDSVTIYGYGKGVTTVKVQDVSGWIPKTVDKYDIPAIDIRYIEFD